ncbi:flagellar hook assembly protein FlgD [Leifsonia sp. Root112D2]|uniref:flagellar hook assembly protein FlgD n=1 Tax=Leifsonia sp. Root112D2 TaxID=1736426 RepID=UPI0006F28809|nr:flagellar hook capping FlgD N-terminal domain-containing protein [Leifsonia sp. Root112D2]KQV07952.1 flagellar hook capping protein [Leifsonia sp. Root112D2]
MPIDTVPPVTNGIYATPPTRAPKQSLDAEAFMSLLVAQLKNQDPSSPMDTGQMIQQTTQLAMMEQMTQQTTTSNENFSLQMRIAASAMVGQTVTYSGKDGETVSGIASAVSFAGPVPQVTVDGVDVPLDVISGVKHTPTTAETTAPADTTTPATTTN